MASEVATPSDRLTPGPPQPMPGVQWLVVTEVGGAALSAPLWLPLRKGSAQHAARLRPSALGNTDSPAWLEKEPEAEATIDAGILHAFYEY